MDRTPPQLPYPPHRLDLALINARQESVLEPTFNFYRKELYAFAYKILRDPEATKMALHDSFMACWRTNAIFTTQDNLASYLYQAIRRKCIDVIKANTKYQGQLSLSELEEPVSEETIMAQITRAEVLKQLLYYVDQLPAQQRKVIQLYFVDGLKTDEIARLLKTSTQTVLNNKTRGLAHLRNIVPVKDVWIVLMLTYL